MIEFVIAFLLLLVLLVYKLHKGGLFDNTEINVVEHPPIANKALTVFYKHHIGAYKHANSIRKEIKKLVQPDPITFIIHYDDPEKLDEHLLQSAVGMVFAEDGKDLYTANYAEQLSRWGYERMVLPVISKAVVATQRYDGFVSMLALSQFTYSKIRTYLKKNALKAPISMEFFVDRTVHVVLPLEQHKELIIPQLLSLEALETKLARHKWDSDIESESCSDPEPEDMEDAPATESEHEEDRKNQ